MGWIIGLLIVIWAILYLIPDLLWHQLQWKGALGARDSHQIALTFDDGPGADTAAILESLNTHGAHATFFVVAERARHYPEVLQAIVQGGHEIGLHGFQHRSMYLFWPWSVRKELEQGIEIIEQITGVRPLVYRPPWGHFNLMTYWVSHQLGLRRVLWTIAPDDWKPGRTAEFIDHYVTQLAQPGAIVVMHDAGGDRKATAQAVAMMIPQLRKLGMEPVRVSDLKPEVSELRRWWTWWETRFTRSWDIDTIASSLGGDPVLRLGYIRFPYRSITLSSGRTVSKGDPMGEIHFGNPALSQMSAGRAGGLRAFHAVMRSLSDLAQYVDEHPKYQHIEVVGGITLLDATSAIEKLGFDRVPVSGFRKWTMWVYLIFLMAIYHSERWRTFHRFLRLHPVLLVMDRETLMKKYRRASNKRQA